MGWLSGYQYRKKVTISGSSGAGENYQVKLSIGSSSGGDFHLEDIAQTSLTTYGSQMMMA